MKKARKAAEETLQEKRLRTLENTKKISEMLETVLTTSKTVKQFCLENEWNENKVSKMLTWLSDLDNIAPGKHLTPGRTSAFRSELSLTPTEKLYCAVYQDESPEDVVAAMPFDAKETIQDVLVNWSDWGLSEREAKVLKFRFIDKMTLDKIGAELGVRRERIRQIEAKALRKLRHPARRRKLKQGLYITKHAESRAREIADEFVEELAKKKAERDPRVIRAKTGLSDDEEEQVWWRLPLEDLDLSVRVYKILKRHGCNYVGDVARINHDELVKIRNVGHKTETEIVYKIREYMPEYMPEFTR